MPTSLGVLSKPGKYERLSTLNEYNRLLLFTYLSLD